MSSESKRVVITGMGIVSPSGSTSQELWESLIEGRSSVRDITNLPTESSEPSSPLPVPFGAPALDFIGKLPNFGDVPKSLSKMIRKSLRMMCRQCQMGVAVGQKAILDAGLLPETFDPTRIGASYNSEYMRPEPDDFLTGITDTALTENGELDISDWPIAGMSRMNPLWLLKGLPNMPAAHLAIFNDLRGPNNSLTLREAGLGAALGEAFHIIQAGKADIMIVGASGSRLSPMQYVNAIHTEVIAERGDDPTAACRPFDAGRTGCVLGEGAGAVAIESLENALAREATIHAELLGGTYTASVGTDGIGRRQTALVNALDRLFSQTGKKPNDVGHVNAHGLSTPSCDAEEASAIKQAFAGRSTPIPVTAAKSCFGNLGAGSGLVELVASIESLKQNRLFPTKNYETPDLKCPISVVSEACEPGDIFVKTSVSPQGQAGAIMVAAYQADS
jgi:3-oxoacyl-[acyl-carrier-protein] synthase II